MAAAFTPQERAVITENLKNAARGYASTVGMRKVSVEQLAEDAGISKGAFYKFYGSKELLFLDVLEELHTEIYSCAQAAFDGNTHLPPSVRATEALLAAFDVIEQTHMINFMEKDVPSLLRKIPEDVKRTHYKCDELRTCMLFRHAGLIPEGGMPVATTAIRALMLTMSNKSELGDKYHDVLELLIRGTCQQLFPE
ncbi:MAG: TetR/AcrR family transcriptional regulator [Oscillospiraceae bacterium]